MVGIDGSDGHRVIRGSNRVIATGSSERTLPGMDIDGKIVISSTDALQLQELPGSIAIIGAGAVGTEFASLFADFGCRVTLIEALPRILPLEDEECSQIVAEALRQRGVQVHTSTPVRGLTVASNCANLSCETEGRTFPVVADKVLVAIGRRPNTAGLGLEELGVRTSRGYVVVDADLRSSVPGVFAIGDCIFTLALAHVATAEGKYVAELLSGGRPRRLIYDNMPRATYCEPETASVGLSEAQAKEQGLDIAVSRFPMRNSAKAAVYGQMEGLVKIISERLSGLVLGVHITGHSATELIAEAALAMQLEATAREIAETVHAHPTVSEAVMECAEGTSGLVGSREN
jgi:dihydrolipoamide dehydrogenase